MRSPATLMPSLFLIQVTRVCFPVRYLDRLSPAVQRLEGSPGWIEENSFSLALDFSIWKHPNALRGFLKLVLPRVDLPLFRPQNSPSFPS